MHHARSRWSMWTVPEDPDDPEEEESPEEESPEEEFPDEPPSTSLTPTPTAAAQYSSLTPMTRTLTASIWLPRTSLSLKRSLTRCQTLHVPSTTTRRPWREGPLVGGDVVLGVYAILLRGHVRLALLASITTRSRLIGVVEGLKPATDSRIRWKPRSRAGLGGSRTRRRGRTEYAQREKRCVTAP